MAQWELAPVDHVRLAWIGADAVAFDLRDDLYLCIPKLIEALERRDGTYLATGRDAFDALIASGLFRAGRASDMDQTFRSPQRTTRGRSRARSRLRDRIDFVRALYFAAARPQHASLYSLLLEPQPTACGAIVDPISRSLMFERWLAWIPGQGRCVYRAHMLRRFLALGGVTAQWVVGVRTWPFEAHCWLQIDDLLLDDDIDRVKAYTPIIGI